MSKFNIFAASILAAILLSQLDAAPPAAVGKTDPAINLVVVRRAVVSGILTAKEGKKALQFYRLRQQKKTGKLNSTQVTAKLKQLQLTWQHGEALLKKLARAISVLVNGDFELGQGNSAKGWVTAAKSPPTRSKKDSHDGSFSMHSKLVNQGAVPSEGLMRSTATVTGGRSYNFEFWVKPVALGPSYLTQYQLQWQDDNGLTVGSTGLVFFKRPVGKWSKVKAPKWAAPKKAKTVLVTFRFVTGAVNGGHGEIYVDDVMLQPAQTPTRKKPTAKTKATRSGAASES